MPRNSGMRPLRALRPHEWHRLQGSRGPSAQSLPDLAQRLCLRLGLRPPKTIHPSPDAGSQGLPRHTARVTVGNKDTLAEKLAASGSIRRAETNIVVAGVVVVVAVVDAEVVRVVVVERAAATARTDAQIVA